MYIPHLNTGQAPQEVTSLSFGPRERGILAATEANTPSRWAAKVIPDGAVLNAPGRETFHGADLQGIDVRKISTVALLLESKGRAKIFYCLDAKQAQQQSC